MKTRGRYAGGWDWDFGVGGGWQYNFGVFGSETTDDERLNDGYKRRVAVR